MTNSRKPKKTKQECLVFMFFFCYIKHCFQIVLKLLEALIKIVMKNFGSRYQNSSECLSFGLIPLNYFKIYFTFILRASTGECILFIGSVGWNRLGSNLNKMSTSNFITVKSLNSWTSSAILAACKSDTLARIKMTVKS